MAKDYFSAGHLRLATCHFLSVEVMSIQDKIGVKSIEERLASFAVVAASERPLDL